MRIRKRGRARASRPRSDPFCKTSTYSAQSNRRYRLARICPPSSKQITALGFSGVTVTVSSSAPPSSRQTISTERRRRPDQRSGSLPRPPQAFHRKTRPFRRSAGAERDARGEVRKRDVLRLDRDRVAGRADALDARVDVVGREREMRKLAFRRQRLASSTGSTSMQLLSPVEIIVQGYCASPQRRTTSSPKISV